MPDKPVSGTGSDGDAMTNNGGTASSDSTVINTGTASSDSPVINTGSASSGEDQSGDRDLTSAPDAIIRARAHKLYEEIQNSLLGDPNSGDSFTEEVQAELGIWINIVSNAIPEKDTGSRWGKFKQKFYARCPVDPTDVLNRAELAIRLLLQKPGSSLRLVRELRYEVRNDLSWNGGPLQRVIIRLTGGSSSMAVAWGALVTTVIGIPFLIWLFSESTMIASVKATDAYAVWNFLETPIIPLELPRLRPFSKYTRRLL